MLCTQYVPRPRPRCSLVPMELNATSWSVRHKCLRTGFGKKSPFVKCQAITRYRSWLVWPQVFNKRSFKNNWCIVILWFQTNDPLPDELLERLVGSQKANAGGLNIKQVVLALFDQRVHSGGRCDTQSVYSQTMNEVMGLESIPETNMAATFHHVALGYSARYYSYLVGYNSN